MKLPRTWTAPRNAARPSRSWIELLRPRNASATVDPLIKARSTASEPRCATIATSPRGGSGVKPAQNIATRPSRSWRLSPKLGGVELMSCSHARAASGSSDQRSASDLPSHAPKSISRSARVESTGRLWGSATIRAVSSALCRSLETTRTRGRAAMATARTRACASPCSLRGGSVTPTTVSGARVDSPWRMSQTRVTDELRTRSARRAG